MATIQPKYDPLLVNKANGTPITQEGGKKRRKSRRSRLSRKHSRTQKKHTKVHRKTGRKSNKKHKRHTKRTKYTNKKRTMRGGKLTPANFSTAHSQNVSATNPVNPNPTMSTVGNGSNSGTASYSINTNITPMESALAPHNVVANPAV
jgi:hypothetical protein